MRDSCVHDVNASTFITWFDYNGSFFFSFSLLRSFDTIPSFNVRLLYIFQRRVLMELNSCSTRVKKIIKVWLSER